MREKIIAILKKNHLHHYGDFEKAVEELEILFTTKIRKPTKIKVDKATCACNFTLIKGIFRCTKCNQTLGQWLLTQNPK
jgi:hypothetical protein